MGEGKRPSNAPSSTLEKRKHACRHTPPHLELAKAPSLAFFYPPQLPVQRLNHSCKTPAGLVQIQVAGPQTLTHGLLAGKTEEGRVSVKASGSEGAGGSGGLLQASLP